MKNSIFIIFLLFSVYFSEAQIVYIPDPNFKAALIAAGVDTNNDGEIQESEAEAVIDLYVTAKSIVSLEGIQSFINLEVLVCSGNLLTSLDVTQNTNLEALECTENNLISLDVTQNLNLERLSFSQNQVNTIDVTQNPNLKELIFSNNQLISLNVAQNPNLEELIFRDNQLTSLDVTQNPNLNFLWCTGNQLTNLDVTQNPNLEALECDRNQLTNLDLSQNPLKIISTTDNLLTSLNIKNGDIYSIQSLRTLGNPNLTCIEVEDIDYANNKNCHQGWGWCIDDWTEFSDNCNLGTRDINKQSNTVYPNPAQNILNINSKEPVDSVRIYSTNGSLIMESSSSSSIDVSELSKGLYFIQIIVNGNSVTKKFIKE